MFGLVSNYTCSKKLQICIMAVEKILKSCKNNLTSLNFKQSSFVFTQFIQKNIFLNTLSVVVVDK
jgi:hypothetical protein